MKKNHKLIKNNVKKDSKPIKVRGQRANIIHMDCSYGCKHYPRLCGECPYDKEV